MTSRSVIGADTQLRGIALHPAGHPRSPTTHNAASLGARTIPVEWVLVYQAAEQLRDQTGLNSPVEVMAEVFGTAG